MSCGSAVAPLLQELGGGPGVIDLVEVHLQRLVEAVDAHRQDGHDQGHDDPQVQLVEAAARLRVERGGSVRVRGSARQPVPQPHDPARHVDRVGRGRRGSLVFVDPVVILVRLVVVVPAPRRIERAGRRRRSGGGRGGGSGPGGGKRRRRRAGASGSAGSRVRLRLARGEPRPPLVRLRRAARLDTSRRQRGNRPGRSWSSAQTIARPSRHAAQGDRPDDAVRTTWR
jgi:hypothetical protein